MENKKHNKSFDAMETFTQMSNPFPGLRPFRMNESHLFFGRNNQVKEVIEKLTLNKFVGIVGKSGIGKSSFVNCGILPKLVNNEELTTANQEVISFRPGAKPLQKMQKAFGTLMESGKFVNEKRFSTSINSSDHLSEIGQKYYDSSGKRLLIYIDQFEEIFRFNEEGDNQEIESFISLIINTIRNTEAPISFIITIRSDFIGDCSKFPEFTKVLNNSQFLIPQMTKEEKREAIVGPIRVMGGKIEEPLVEEIIQDINDRHDQLPLMQHALMRTWDYWQSQELGNSSITFSCYERIGGMEKALSVHANEIFNELDSEKKKICERLFKSITEKGVEGRSIRRPASIREIARIANAKITDVKEVVEHFRKPGRTILTPSENVELTEDTIVDISHESLMRIWEVLSEWLEEEHEAIKEYLHISEAAEMQQLGKGGLLKSPELQVALNWREENKPTKEWGIRHDKAYDRTMQFLDFSEKKFLQEQRLKEKLQKLRLVIFKSIALVFGIGAIIALAFFFYAQQQRKEAIKQQSLANEQKILANEQAKKARKNAEEALRQKQIAENQKQKAIWSSNVADEQKQKALEQRARAEKEREFAMEQKDKATFAQQKAEELRLLSIARSMAVKSVQESDKIVKSLSARQAYNLYKDNGGKKIDPDIYNALYYAVKELKGDNYNKAKAHYDNVRTIIAAENSKFLYSAGSDGQIFRWERSEGKFIPQLIDHEKGKVHKTIALSKDGKTLAIGGNYSYMKLINLDDLSKRKINIRSDNLQYLTFSPDGERVIYLEDNKRIMQWDFNELKEVLTSESKITCIDINPKGQYLAVGKTGCKVLLVDMINGVELDLFNPESQADITALEFSDDGEMLAVGDMSGVVRLLAPYSGKVRYTLSGHQAMVNNIAFSHAGDKLATASFDHSVRIWSLNNPYEQPVILKDHNDWVWSVEFDQSDKYLLAGCRDKLIRSWILDIDKLASMICEDEQVNRNFTKSEWDNYVAEDVEYECTCAENQEVKQESENKQLVKQ